MEQRRWVNRYQPQTLVTATMLLYIEGVFNMARGVQALTVLGLLMIPAAYFIAQDRRLGWYAGVAAASASVLVRLSIYGFHFNTIFSVIFPMILVVLLMHPMSREHQRVWFK
ncbi:MAG: hypothetical protein OSA06_05000 [Acidimicrobiales bacterium]|nr:hypothetical protein [Acidimicrobiales bacterium]